MLKRGLRLLPANLKLRMACVAAVLVFVATLLVTLSTLAVAERGMKSVIGDQQYAMLASAASFMDDRIAARLAEGFVGYSLPRAQGIALMFKTPVGQQATNFRPITHSQQSQQRETNTHGTRHGP